MDTLRARRTMVLPPVYRVLQVGKPIGPLESASWIGRILREDRSMRGLGLQDRRPEVRGQRERMKQVVSLSQEMQVELQEA